MSHKPSIDYVFRHQHKPKKTPLMCQSSRRFPSDHTGRTSSRCVCPSGRWYNLPEFKINVIFFFFSFSFFLLSVIWSASPPLHCVAAGHHTVYIGVHVPKSYHRRRRHRRKSSHKDKRERAEHGTEGYKSDGETADEAVTNVLKPLSEFWWSAWGKASHL